MRLSLPVTMTPIAGPRLLKRTWRLLNGTLIGQVVGTCVGIQSHHVWATSRERIRRGRVEARIKVEGAETQFESLWDWLQHEPDLRGRLSTRQAPAAEGAMGGSIEMVVAMTPVAAVVATALARALSTWLVQRRADLTVKVTGPSGQQVTVSGRRVADPEALLRAVLERGHAEEGEE
jgi:hypothetical protein